MAFEGSSFAATAPFLTPPFSIELTEEGLWRTGGASITETKKGDDILGTLTLRTDDGFDAGMQVQVLVAFFSLGPSFSDRDDYTAADLNMGVVIDDVEGDCLSFWLLWGCSAVGRAPEWHSGGQGFDSPQLHHDKLSGSKGFTTCRRRPFFSDFSTVNMPSGCFRRTNFSTSTLRTEWIQPIHSTTSFA